jgi:uncharacterized protein
MNFVHDLLLNYYFLTFILAWVSSTLLKAALHSWKHKTKFHLMAGFQNGGMPSGHTTVVVSLTCAVLLRTGLSDLFFVAAIFSSIIMSDAFRLRKNIGLQGDKLNELLKEFNEETIKVVYGHSFTQVVGGVILGILCAVVLNAILF